MATLGLEVDQVNENENNTLQKSSPENIQYVTLDDGDQIKSLENILLLYKQMLDQTMQMISLRTSTIAA